MIGLAQATDRAGQSFGAFNQIGNNFAQAILNGQGIRDSLSSSLLAFGGQGIGTALDQTDLTGFVKTAFTDGISAAFDSSEFKRNSAAGFALALGQAVEGNFGQAAFTAAGNALFGEIGALVGSILGDLVFGESVPKFQVRGRNATQATDAGTDRVLATDFGADLEIAFRGIEDAAKRQIVRGYSDFLSAVSGIVDDPGQREAIAGVISRFGVSSRSGPDDIEGQLELLFSDITDTFGAATQAFIRQAETLEGQVQRLADVLGFADQLADAADLLGRAFASSRTELEDFSAQLLDAFDGTADELSGVLNRVLNAAFSEEELAQQTIRNARQKATDLLTDLGIGVSEDTFSQQGLRDLIDNFLGELGPEETAQLLQAGDAIARLIDAEASLADERGTNIDRLRDDWQRAIDGIRGALDQELITGPGQTPLESLNAAESQLRALASQAEGGDLDAARQIPALFNTTIGLAARAFGSTTDTFDVFRDDIRGLLEGLELGPDAISIESQMLSVQQQQLSVLERIAGNAGVSTEGFSTVGQTQTSSNADLVTEIREVRQELTALNEKTSSANDDRREAAEVEIARLEALIAQLQAEARQASGLRPTIPQTRLR